MGWAKYMEDNLEIINERLSQMAEKRNTCPVAQTTIKMTVCITPLVVAEKKPVRAAREEKYIICKDCGRVFSFPVRDQLFYEKMGWNPPKRCKACREHCKIKRLMCPAY